MSTKNNLDLVLLPPYTTERYYVLSEIEQRAIFVGLDTNGNLDCKIAGINEAGARGFYILWKMNEENSDDDIKTLDLSISRVLKAANQLKVDLSSAFIAIEVFLTARSDWAITGDKKRIEDAMTWLKNTYNVGGICFGASDTVSGTCALEALSDFVASIEFESLSAEHNLVIAESKVNFLGHDPLREPEAEQNVFQAQMIHIADNVKANKSWAKALVSRSLYAEMHEDDEKAAPTKGPKVFKYDHLLTWGLSAGILALLWYVLTYFNGHIYIQDQLFPKTEVQA
jgi:hypothetical protein